MMKIINTTEARDWFFYFTVNNEVIYYRVAVWGTYEDGTIGGLLPAQMKKGEFRLVGPPSAELGGYIHWDDMTDNQRKKAVSILDEEKLKNASDNLYLNDLEVRPLKGPNHATSLVCL